MNNQYYCVLLSTRIDFTDYACSLLTELKTKHETLDLVHTNIVNQDQ